MGNPRDCVSDVFSSGHRCSKKAAMTAIRTQDNPGNEAAAADWSRRFPRVSNGLPPPLWSLTEVCSLPDEEDVDAADSDAIGEALVSIEMAVLDDAVTAVVVVAAAAVVEVSLLLIEVGAVLVESELDPSVVVLVVVVTSGVVDRVLLGELEGGAFAEPEPSKNFPASTHKLLGPLPPRKATMMFCPEIPASPQASLTG